MYRWLFLLSLLATAVSARVEVLEFGSPDEERRYKNLIAELRCLVCQNQNLADSDADLAADLRRITHRMIVEGKSDGDIVEFMVERYGDFVLYRPPLKPETAALWIGPAVLFGAGVVILVVFVRRRERRVAIAVDPRSVAAAKRVLDD